MAEGTSVGAIYYEVEADTSKLVNSVGPLDKSLDGLSKSFGKTDKAANDANFKMKETAKAVQNLGKDSGVAATAIGSLGKLFGAIFSIKTAAAIVDAADSYNAMSERIRMATSSTQEYEHVQKRLLDTANGTYRALSEAQELYVLTAGTLKSLGYDTDQSMDIVDSLSYAFVKNATAADRAKTTIDAVTKALNKGKVEADGWQSILAAVPTVVDDLAASTGRSTAEILSLGAQGKITGRELSESLRKSLDENKAAADGMATTVRDAFQAIRNNLSVYIGEVNRATGTTGGLAESIKRVADEIKNASIDDLVRNIDAITAAAEGVKNELADLLRPFIESVDETTNFVPESFTQMVLRTVKEFDGLVDAGRGSVAVVGALWEGVAHNIPVFFENAYNQALSAAANFVNTLADLVNKPLQALGGEGFGKVDFGAGAARELVDLGEAASNAWNTATNRVKVYDQVVDKVGLQGMLRAAAAAETEYASASKQATVAAASGTASSEKLTAAQRKEMRAREQNKKTLDEMAEALKQAGLEGEALAVANAKAQLNEFATPQQVQSVEALARALYQVQQAKTDKEIINQADPIKAEIARYEEQLTAYQGLRDRMRITDDEYLAYRESAERAHEENMLKLQEERFRSQSEFNDLLMTGIDAFGEAATSTLVGLITQTASAADAARAFAGVILKEVVGSFVQMGIEQVKAWVMGRAAAAVAGAAYAAGVAGQVQANTALAAQATFASISAIPIVGPFMAPAMAAQAAVTAGALGAPAIPAAAVSAGRQYGGPVAPNGMYRINETGRPEVLNMANGQQFLLPNSRGEVVSNRDATAQATGEGGTPTIHNHITFSPVIQTSWPVSDKDVRELVVRFNDALRDGMKLRT